MKIDTALNHQKRFRTRVHDIYSSARLCGASHQHILERIKTQVYSDPAWKLVPGWVQRNIFQLGADLLGRIYQPDLHASELDKLLASARNGEPTKPVAYVRWKLSVDGTEQTTDQICKRRAAGDDDIWKRTIGAHVWNHKPERLFMDSKVVG